MICTKCASLKPIDQTPGYCRLRVSVKEDTDEGSICTDSVFNPIPLPLHESKVPSLLSNLGLSPLGSGLLP